MIAVSVIIPVFNAEAYLRECVGSLLRQTLAECEFIFVNDGSTDNSLGIIEDFQQQDSRIKIINQQNQGVSVARNKGIAAATGKYLGFVDADDFVDEDMFDKLYQFASNTASDIVISNFFAEQGRSKIILQFDFPANRLYDRDDIRTFIFPYFIKKDLLNSACNKIFRTEMIVDNKISFPEGVALGEDAIFNMKAFNKSESAFYTDYSGYHYREVVGSATRNVFEKKYFEKALETFHFPYGEIMDLDMEAGTIHRLKSIRLGSTVLSLIHLYFNSHEMRLWNRFAVVRQMLHNPEVSQAIKECFDELSASASDFQRFLLKSVRNKYIYRIYLAVLYSRFRNS
jgi:glycosyltransferase involved in cell wall biosynthesis